MPPATQSASANLARVLAMLPGLASLLLATELHNMAAKAFVVTLKTRTILLLEYSGRRKLKWKDSPAFGLSIAGPRGPSPKVIRGDPVQLLATGHPDPKSVLFWAKLASPPRRRPPCGTTGAVKSSRHYLQMIVH
jgi:hypothetical protein